MSCKVSMHKLQYCSGSRHRLRAKLWREAAQQQTSDGAVGVFCWCLLRCTNLVMRSNLCRTDRAVRAGRVADAHPFNDAGTQRNASMRGLYFRTYQKWRQSLKNRMRPMYQVQSCQAKQLKSCTKSSRSPPAVPFETLPQMDARPVLQCCTVAHHLSYPKHRMTRCCLYRLPSGVPMPGQGLSW